MATVKKGDFVRARVSGIDIQEGQLYEVQGVYNNGDIIVFDDVMDPHTLQAGNYYENTADTAMKFDSGKPPISLIPRSAIEAEARVLGFGAEKYGRDNWRKGMSWSRVVDAIQRHALAIADGELTDPESGEPHAAHIRAGCGFLIEYAEKGLGTNDLTKGT